MFTLIPSDAYRVMPWKNGRGITYEIAAEKEQEPGWRLSIAAIDRDGTFSDFSGYDRTIMTLDGSDIELDFHDDASNVLLKRWQPFRFTGEREVSARLLGGPVRDFNVMTRRGTYEHEVLVIPPLNNASLGDSLVENGWDIPAGEFSFLLVLAGQILSPLVAGIGDVIRVDGPANLELRTSRGTSTAIVTIKRAAGGTPIPLL